MTYKVNIVVEVNAASIGEACDLASRFAVEAFDQTNVRGITTIERVSAPEKLHWTEE